MSVKIKPYDGIMCVECGKFALNRFAGRGEVLDALPWDSGTKRRLWDDNDNSGLYWYLEKVYRINSNGKADAALSLHASAHSFNEVQDYLCGLQGAWDGVPRLDTLFIDYLGAKDTAYNRAVARKAYVAAVARAMTPGCKYDTMIILNGAQGIGKSTLIDKMSKGWFNDSIRTFEGKEASELIQGVWLVEVSELDAFNKSDVARIKQFVSLRADRFRAAYARNVKEHPRTCVFFGTTIGAAFLGMKGVNWIKESLGLSDIQRNAEKQLTNVLNNMGAESGSFEKLTAKASALQGQTDYGDEALIGGAAEFSTYMQDSDAVAVMMETLTNYAAGMSGGGEVGYEEMVQYATNLGKITTGSFDAMTKKGFEFTDAQKKIIENGTDMEKALTISEVINESWAGLANNMANTPQGKIIQLKNAFGDMREELGTRIYPAIMQLFDTISANSASISNIVTGLAKPINLVVNVLNKAVKAASAVYNFFARNWSKIAPIVGGIVTAIVAYNAALLVHKAYLAGAAVVQGIKTVAEYAHAKSIMATVAAMGSEATAAQLEAAGLTAETVATASATVAQGSFNTALWACPITWIIALLIALIVVFVMFTEQIMGAIFWLGALFKNIGLWIANCGIAAWAVIKNVGLWFANLGLAIWQVIKNIGAWFGNLGQAIWAVIQNVGAWFGNLGMGVWNVLKAAASNIATAFKNGWIDIQVGFWSMVKHLKQQRRGIIKNGL